MNDDESIAIVGLSGRFPGARNVEAFWRNLCEGVESIAFFSDEELAAVGIDPAVRQDPTYVKASGVLEDVELFDASFFGYTPREAEGMDPQHRLFLEDAWTALEQAGYNPETYPGAIAVYAGLDLNTYLLNNLLAGRSFVPYMNDLETLIGSDKDFLATRVSYKLNLTGPSVVVQTACSTSLAAAALACQSLLDQQCDMALAGGVSVRVPQKRGHLYQPGSVLAPDGHCRAFDARAGGTVLGNGLGIVVLKRLSNALADGDQIYAVIKGWAINNDGSLKAGFTAPSVDGQAEVIALAQAMAGVTADTITYVEAHGTGTELGDPIEIAALTQAFRASTDQKGFCAIGSVKTNIGHLNTAAGVASLIKATLALKHGLIPPSLHFEQPNPRIDFANSPFYVNATLREWPTDGRPRRAGVSSLGIGGTNVHLVLEEASRVAGRGEASGEKVILAPESRLQLASPVQQGWQIQNPKSKIQNDQTRPYQLLLLSAKTSTALAAATANLVAFLKDKGERMKDEGLPSSFILHPSSLADVAYTLQVGRKAFSHRRMVVCRDWDDAINALTGLDPRRVLTRQQEPITRPVAFMFPGQGSQYANMGRELYQMEPLFQQHVDDCARLLQPHLGLDIRGILYPADDEGRMTEDERPDSQLQPKSKIQNPKSQIDQTALAQPALFVTEYALAQLWLAWGIRPQAMIGHSIGEYVAACLAGVFSLEDALALVAARGRLMQQLPAGSMLVVSLPEAEAQAFLDDFGVEDHLIQNPKSKRPSVRFANQNPLSLAAVNGPAQCVVSGPTAAVAQLEERLTAQRIACQRLHTSHAFHSAMMEAILPTFIEQARRVRWHPPQIPFISNVTGTWITAAQATSAGYWASHLRQSVRFADGVQELLKEPARVLLEVGPGRTLTTLVVTAGKNDELGMMNNELKNSSTIHHSSFIIHRSMRHAQEGRPDGEVLLNALGQLWLAGVPVEWPAFHRHEQRRRRPLPTYPFEGRRYWVEADHRSPTAVLQPLERSNVETFNRSNAPSSWFYMPVWKQTAPFHPSCFNLHPSACWLVFTDTCGLGPQLAQRLAQSGQQVVVVEAGTEFGRPRPGVYTIHPQRPQDYKALLQALVAEGRIPQTIVHLWSVTEAGTGEASGRPASGARITFSPLASPLLGYDSLLNLARALGKQGFSHTLPIGVITNHVQAVTGDEMLCPEKATVLGPCRVIPQEYPNLQCRSLDVVLPEPGSRLAQELVDSLLAELATPSADTVVAYRGRHRFVQLFEPVRLEAPPGAGRLRERGVYLITGGLGGIGLTLAEYLAQTVRARLILTGRSTFPTRDKWGRWLDTHDEQDPTSRKIWKAQELERLGAEVLVLRADVADLAQMQAAVAQANEHFGPIQGVIHCAGVPDGALIPRRTPEMTAAVLSPKVQGTLILDQILGDAPLDFFVLCSSLASILAPMGQVGYCAANAFLDAFAHYKTARDGTFTVAINWDTWQEVGMAANYRAGPVAGGRWSVANPKFRHPLLEQCLVQTADQVVYSTHFDLSQHWVLGEHRLPGGAILPGTTFLEIAVAALYQLNAERGMMNDESDNASAIHHSFSNGSPPKSKIQNPEWAIEIQETYFLHPLIVREGEVKEVRTILSKQGDGFEFVMVSQSPDDREEWLEHARGKIAWVAAEPPTSHSLPAMAARCQEQETTTTEAYRLYGGLIALGPRWDNFKRVQFGRHEGLACLELPEVFTADNQVYYLHPALLGTATGFLIGKVKGEGLYLPFSYKRIRLHAPLSARIFSYAQYVPGSYAQKDHLKFDVTILDEQGRELVTIEEHTLRKVDPAKMSSKLNVESSGPFEPSTSNLQPSTSAGMRPAEGVEAFRRILAGTLSQVVLSTQDLQRRLTPGHGLAYHPALLEEAKEGLVSKPTHPRPPLSSAYVAPGNQTEQTLAGIWQELLGIGQVGAHDDFFELGGTSLLATQLFARIRRVFQVELSLGLLFEEPTITDVARRIEMTRWTGPDRPPAPSDEAAGREEIVL
ncbi:MAG: SDR family NAD(P)-dependent oxidoreductase [Chloroflexota bacterium]